MSLKKQTLNLIQSMQFSKEISRFGRGALTLGRLGILSALVAGVVVAQQGALPEYRLGEQVVIKGQKYSVEKRLKEGRLLLVPPLPPTASLGAFITPVDATASSVQDGTPLTVVKTIDGSGWGETFVGSGVYVHTADSWAGGGTLWVSGGGDWKGWAQYDLGKAYNVNGVYVWNYNESGDWRTRGFRRVQVQASLDGKQWDSLGEYDLALAPGSPDYTGEAVAFGKTVRAQHMKLQSLGNHRNGEQTGLSEVRFSNADEKAVIGATFQPKYPRPQHPTLALGQPLEGAENMVFPGDMRLVDVTQPPYMAKGDGVADDTAAIQNALDAHNNTGAYLYFPNGIYLISNTLRWPGNEPKNLGLQGQSMRGTVLKLKDACPTFEDANNPKAMIWCGQAPAQRFAIEVHNLTFDSGVDNPGAIGTRFMANNQGGMFDVTILSGDGQGVAGVDLAYTDEQGPELLKNVRVVGFDVGILTAHSVASVTMENVTVEQQNVAGLRNGGQPLTVGNLKSINSVPAVINSSGLLTLVGAELHGSGAAREAAAIVNNGWLFARDVKTSGYLLAINNVPSQEQLAGPVIPEFRSMPVKTLGGTATKTLHLPIKAPPAIPWDPLEKWVSVEKVGAVADDSQSDADGIQNAIDSGAPTVYLPRGTYVIDKTIKIRGNVRRLIGGRASFDLVESMRGREEPIFRFEDGVAPAVVIERLSTDFSHGKHYFLEHASKRTLIMRNLMINLHAGNEGVAYRNSGTGPLFVEDVVGASFLITKQDVWARQFNVEPLGTKIVNDGGTLWILGYKCERPSTIVLNKNGGRTEMLGGLSQTHGAPQMPMFINDGGEMSVVLSETDWDGTPYMTLVEETRSGEKREWRDETKLRGARALMYEGHP